MAKLTVDEIIAWMEANPAATYQLMLAMPLVLGPWAEHTEGTGKKKVTHHVRFGAEGAALVCEKDGATWAWSFLPADEDEEDAEAGADGLDTLAEAMAAADAWATEEGIILAPGKAEDYVVADA